MLGPQLLVAEPRCELAACRGWEDHGRGICWRMPHSLPANQVHRPALHQPLPSLPRLPPPIGLGPRPAAVAFAVAAAFAACDVRCHASLPALPPSWPAAAFLFGHRPAPSSPDFSSGSRSGLQFSTRYLSFKFSMRCLPDSSQHVIQLEGCKEPSEVMEAWESKAWKGSMQGGTIRGLGLGSQNCQQGSMGCPVAHEPVAERIRRGAADSVCMGQRMRGGGPHE